MIDRTLYWAAVASDEEARYLCAVLNASVTTMRVRPLMSYGKDERDIHKHVWRLPIPAYDRTVALHAELAQLAGAAEAEVAALELPDDKGYVWQRQQVRAHLAASPAGIAIERAVTQLLASP